MYLGMDGHADTGLGAMAVKNRGGVAGAKPEDMNRVVGLLRRKMT